MAYKYYKDDRKQRAKESLRYTLTKEYIKLFLLLSGAVLLVYLTWF